MDNGYGLEKCGVVGGWNLTTDTRELCMKEKMSEGLFLKNGNSGTGYVMVAGGRRWRSIPRTWRKS